MDSVAGHWIQWVQVDSALIIMVSTDRQVVFPDYEDYTGCQVALCRLGIKVEPIKACTSNAIANRRML